MTRGDDADARLTDAARRLFLEHGFEGTSTAAICREARVSKETLYARYPRKDLLFADVLLDLVTHAGPPPGAPAAHEPSPAGPLTTGPAGAATLAEDLRALAAYVVAAMMRPEYVALFRLVVAEAPRQPEIAERFVEVAPRRALATVAAILARHGVDHVDHDVAARAFMGPLLTYLLLGGVFSPQGVVAPAPATVDAQVDLFLRALGR